MKGYFERAKQVYPSVYDLLRIDISDVLAMYGAITDFNHISNRRTKSLSAKSL